MAQNRIQGSNKNSEPPAIYAGRMDKLWENLEIRLLICNKLNVLEVLSRLAARNVIHADFAKTMQVREKRLYNNNNLQQRFQNFIMGQLQKVEILYCYPSKLLAFCLSIQPFCSRALDIISKSKHDQVDFFHSLAGKCIFYWYVREFMKTRENPRDRIDKKGWKVSSKMC